MPPARSASSAARSRTGSTARSGSSARARAQERQQARAAGRPAPRHVPLRSAAIRVRWERLGRIALLVVLAAVVAVYAEHAVSYLSTRAQNARQQAIVRSLQVRQRALEDPTTIVRRARQFGMTRSGEQPYAITGQSSR